MNKETGGPAFQNKAERDRDGYSLTGGMTLRDYFAAKAMQANVLSMASVSVESDNPTPMTWHNEVARLSYMTADAMLEARK